MPQFGTSLTGNSRVIIYDPNMFKIQDTGYESLTKLFGNNHQIVKLSYFHLATWPGVLNKDPTVWLEGARSPQRLICNYIKICK